MQNIKPISLHDFNAATWSVWCWGVYLILTGVVLLLFPDKVLPLMGFEPEMTTWVRMTGLLSAVLGFYYIQVARYQYVLFYRWKIMGHLIGVTAMLYFFFSGFAPSAILTTAAIDLLAAAWTGVMLLRR